MSRPVILILLIMPYLAIAGSSDPFSSLEITLQLEHNLNQNDFHKYWQVKDGCNFSYTTPFYFGNLLAGFDYLRYQSQINSAPNYQSYYIYAGLEYDIPIIKDFIISPGVKLGNYMMNFNIDTHSSNRYESEIGLEYYGKLAYQLNKTVQINWEVSHKRIFTYKQIYFSLFKAGLSFTLNKPDWFKDFFE